MTKLNAISSILLLLLLLVIGILCLTEAVEAQSTEASSDTPERRVLEEIVVTAARREEHLQDASMSVSALTGDSLSAIGAKELDDYFGFVPSVNSASNTIGERGGKNIIIRGISNTRIASSNDTASLTATTGFYINDVPVTAVDTELFDIDRVEVLRGPQGTLYGAASLGGAAKLFLNKPDLFELSGAGEGTFHAIAGGGQGGDVNGMINIPVYEGVFGVRVVGSRRERDGFIDSAIIPLDNTSGRITTVESNALGVGSGRGNPRIIENSNSSTATGVSFSALYTPNDKLSVEFTELWQSTEYDDLSFINTRFDGAFLQEKYEPEPTRSDVTISVLNIAYDFGAFRLVSNSGYYNRDYDEKTDFTQVAYRDGYTDVLDFIPAIVSLDTQLDVDTFTQEVRVESNRDAFSNPIMSRLDWVFGGYFMDEHRNIIQINDGFGWQAAAPNNPLPVPNDIRQATHNEVDDQSTAIFLDINYNITDQLSIGGGIRFFDLSNEFQGAALNRANPEIPAMTSTDFKEDGDSIRFGASYDFNDSIKLFGSYSEGFRLGGAGAPINLDTNPVCAPVLEEHGLEAFADGRFNSDNVETFEIGLKTAFASGRATLNVAAYQTDWTGLQQQVRIGDLSDVCFAVITANVGKAEVDGFEVELAALATDRFSVQASLAYTDARIVDPGPGGLTDPGDPILNVPEWSGSLIARYETPTDALGGGTFFIQADVRNVGERDPVTGNSNPALRLEEYTLLGARLGVVFGDEKPTTLTLWGKNLGNDNVDQNARNRLGVPDVIVNQGLPRTFGLTLRKDF